jgi:hypothetical protein
MERQALAPHVVRMRWLGDTVRRVDALQVGNES